MIATDAEETIFGTRGMLEGRNTELRTLYEDADDFFVYMHGYAPNIPRTGGLTLNSAINQLFVFLDALAENERDLTARHWLRLSWKEVIEAKVAFEKKDDGEGRKRLENGEVYLTNAQEKKPMTLPLTVTQS